MMLILVLYLHDSGWAVLVPGASQNVLWISLGVKVQRVKTGGVWLSRPAWYQSILHSSNRRARQLSHKAVEALTNLPGWGWVRIRQTPHPLGCSVRRSWGFPHLSRPSWKLFPERCCWKKRVDILPRKGSQPTWRFLLVGQGTNVNCEEFCASQTNSISNSLLAPTQNRRVCGSNRPVIAVNFFLRLFRVMDGQSAILMQGTSALPPPRPFGLSTTASNILSAATSLRLVFEVKSPQSDRHSSARNPTKWTVSLRKVQGSCSVFPLGPRTMIRQSRSILSQNPELFHSS